MVHDIIGVIEERCEEGRYPQDFRQRIYNCNTFTSAQDEAEKYSK